MFADFEKVAALETVQTELEVALKVGLLTAEIES